MLAHAKFGVFVVVVVVLGTLLWLSWGPLGVLEGSGEGLGGFLEGLEVKLT